MALLCVLLAHALAIYYLTLTFEGAGRGLQTAIEWTAEPITWMELEEPSDAAPNITFAPAPTRMPEPVAPGAPAAEAADSSAIADTSGVDWPLEGKKAAARVLAREAEAERIAKMFAGPGGTWASLTKRQRSTLNKFRWKPGVQLEYDSQGNQIYRLGDGCMIVNSGFIACKIGKVKARGDMFENMREYFDEMRLPETNEGNGTEPETRR